MKPVTQKKVEWLQAYRAMKKAADPKECARCGIGGRGWSSEGGSFEPHHVFRRAERWRILNFLPLCPSCHHWVEHNAQQAREDGWIIAPQQTDIFQNKKPKQ